MHSEDVFSLYLRKNSKFDFFRPLKLDGYAKSVHVPLGSGAKGGLPKYPTIQALIPVIFY